MSGIESRLAALKQKYAIKLKKHLQELEQVLLQVQTQPEGRAEYIEQALNLTHKLHGTSGTYGFTEVSLAMGTGEDLLRQMQTRTTLDLETWEQLQACLQQAYQAYRSTEPGEGEQNT